jgi:hypothetical protein
MERFQGTRRIAGALKLRPFIESGLDVRLNTGPLRRRGAALGQQC